MPYLWYEEHGGDTAWLAQSLTETFRLQEAEADGDARDAEGRAPGNAGIWLLPAHERTPGERQWILLWQAEADVRINGDRQELGVRVLADRDEVIVDGSRRYFFTSESLPVVTQLPESEAGVRCQLCRGPIEAGESSVSCPSCGARHHQRDDLACWTHAESCSHCFHSTEMAELSWSPEGS